METQTQDKTQARPADMADPNDTKGRELTVSNGAPPAEGPKTVAQERKEKLEKIITELATRSKDYQPFLHAHGIPFDLFTSIIKQAIIRNPDILNCSTASILAACMYAAKDGVMPDGKDAAIVPFKTTATYMPMYAGMLKVAYGARDDTGHMIYRDVNGEVIYQGEEALFEYEAGTDPKISFKPTLDRDSSKPIVGAFCVIRTNNGGVFVEVVGTKELAKIAAVGKAGGPRKAWAGEFAKKDALRRCLKRTPKDDRLRQLLQHDEESYLPIDGDGDSEGAAIPTDALFDDTVHLGGEPQVDKTDDQEGNPHMGTARADLMASETEEQLDAVIAKINKATNTGRKKSGAFSEEERDELLQNAEQLRAHRFPKEKPALETPDDVKAAVEETVQVTENEVVDHAPGEDFVQAGDDVDDGIDHDAGDDLTRPLDPEQIAATKAAAAQPALNGAATQASSPSPSPSAGSTSPSPTASPAGGATSASPSEWKVAAERMTAVEAELADPSLGIHFKAGIKPNATGQVPVFNGADEIVCWAKPDRDIPTREAGAAPAASEPQIRTNPENREEPPPVTEADMNGGYDGGAADDGYGEEQKPFVYQLKVHPAKPPKEYADPVEWRDAVLFKINSLNADVGPRWWADNKEFVIAAIPHAKVQAGRIVAVAVSKKWPGADEIVNQHGPFQ